MRSFDARKNTVSAVSMKPCILSELRFGFYCSDKRRRKGSEGINQRRGRTGDEAVAVADEPGPDDAGVDAVGRHVGVHLPQPFGERSGVQDVGELGQRVRLGRIVRSGWKSIISNRPT